MRSVPISVKTGHFTSHENYKYRGDGIVKMDSGLVTLEQLTLYTLNLDVKVRSRNS